MGQTQNQPKDASLSSPYAFRMVAVAYVILAAHIASPLLLLLPDIARQELTGLVYVIQWWAFSGLLVLISGSIMLAMFVRYKKVKVAGKPGVRLSIALTTYLVLVALYVLFIFMFMIAKSVFSGV